jgi:hypothetical protein
MNLRLLPSARQEGWFLIARRRRRTYDQLAVVQPVRDEEVFVAVVAEERRQAPDSHVVGSQ